ncbi:MAG: hypothetical protein GXZ06_05180 [Tissierellia bacterium]|nr:hypothetical protein [Tissierellia bacterium]
MLYKNPYCRKMKNSFIMIVSCGYCKTDIARYQKVGRGNLLRMHIDRIIEGNIDFSKQPKALLCPNCKEQLGTRITLKREKKEVYKMLRSTFNTREES